MGRPIVPSGRVIECLRGLAEYCLQPARDLLRELTGDDVRMIISSGYRPHWLNKAIGGSKTSAHLCGDSSDRMEAAADFRVIGTDRTLLDTARLIAGSSDVHYDQLIYEGTWIHIGWRSQGPRQELLTARFSRGTMGRRKTTYFHGLLA